MDSLTRYKNTIWCHEEKPGTVPPTWIEAPSYPEAKIALQTFKLLGKKLDEKHPVYALEKCQSGKEHCWEIRLKSASPGLLGKIRNFFPLTRKVRGPLKTEISIENKSLKTSKNKPHIHIACQHPKESISLDQAEAYPKSYAARCVMAPYSDPFTSLAISAFQTYEKSFSGQSKIDCVTRIVAKDHDYELRFQNDAPLTLEEKRENRHTLTMFMDFLKQEYGWHNIRYIQYAYQFNLQEMWMNGEALTPEHVYRINIGMGNIELHEVQRTFRKLIPLKEELLKIENTDNTKLLDVLPSYNESTRMQDELSGREMRGIYHAAEKISGSQIPRVSHAISVLDSIHSPCAKGTCTGLENEAFNLLMEILAPSGMLRDRMFTGRKILHKSILGFYTNSGHKSYKPWVDQQELLQVFPDLERKQSWENYYELLSHVVVKKHLVRPHPTEHWRVGAMIPAPADEQGHRRWYTVTSCMDNSLGVFSYTLEPATNDPSMPFIQLYRSTASSPYAMNGIASVLSDLYPFSAPGGEKPWAGMHYQHPYIFERTIPIWVAYYTEAREAFDALLKTPVTKGSGEKYKEVMNLCYNGVIRMAESFLHLLESPYEVPEELVHISEHILENRKREKISWQTALEKLKKEDFHLEKVPQCGTKAYANYIEEAKRISQVYFRLLHVWADAIGELPKYKIAQNVAFLGHSLGGALCQNGLYRFAYQCHRVPLADRKFICFAAGDPGLSPKDNQRFIAYGNKHADLLKRLGPIWQVRHRLETGDPVNQSGSLHMGSTAEDSPSYSKWLDVKTELFKPLDGAEAPEIWGAPIHGRRIGAAREHIDYELDHVSAKDLHRFDTAWFLNSEMRKRWGYRILISPKIGEGLRQTIGILGLPVMDGIRWVREKMPIMGHELRDSRQYFFCVLSKSTLECVIQEGKARYRTGPVIPKKFLYK